jgi:hypothetical protein
MFILIPVLILFLIPLAILVLNQTDVKTGYAWFLALAASIIAWVFFWLASNRLPTVVSLMQWQAEGLFPANFTLLLDQISWPFALLIVALSLAVLLVDVLDYDEIDPHAWASGLAITGLGVVAILAENPLTLLLAWSAMDISETLMLLQRVPNRDFRERVVIAFSVRVAGILLVLSATLRARFLGTYLTFEQIPVSVRWYLLLAAGLRLGVFPPHQSFFREVPLRRGLGTIVRLVPVASSLVLLARVANVGPMQQAVFPLLLGAALAGLYGALSWASAESELDGRPNWILAMSAFSFVAAVNGLPQVSVSWGMALIVSGGMLFLLSLPGRQSIILGLIGLVSVSMLPYTPHWQGVRVYVRLHPGFVVTFILIQIVLLFGYLRHLLSKISSASQVENWMLILYPVGLIVLPISHWGVNLLGGGIVSPEPLPLASHWWAGIVVLLVVAVSIVARWRQVTLPPQIVATLGQGLSLQWLYLPLWWGYRTVGKLFEALSSILEGEGGVLWAILLLSLLIAVLRQRAGWQP